MIKKRIQNEDGLMEPNQTEIQVYVGTEITDEEHLIIDKLKALIIRNETKVSMIAKWLRCWISNPGVSCSKPQGGSKVAQSSSFRGQ